ncbi:MAG: NAD(P)/FAD-dependent oxidoreductase [Eubacteriales bacterium]
MREYVIIGNGTAAVGTIEGIRSMDKKGKITVVSEEKHGVYCRPLISYYLEGKTTLDKMNYRPEDFYEKNGCTVLYGKKADKVDSEAKTVYLTDGTSLHYDSLCVATGSSHFVPPFSGLETVGKKFGFMTLDDALALEAAITPSSRVLIVGAGLIGLKCAEGLAGRVQSITVCDLADRVLSSILDSECAALMQKELEAHGVSLMLGDSVSEFNGNEATMKSGAVVGFDVLVLAVGVRSNISTVKECGAECNRGIVVNSHMKTTCPDVFAAGDCAEGYDASIGKNRVLAILPNAYMQGHTAGINMAGGNEEYLSAIPMNSIGFFGLHAMSAGCYDGELNEERGDGYIKRLYVKDDHLIGFMLVGNCIERAGILTNLIRERTPLSSIDFEMLKKITTTAVFSHENRRKKFGSVV